MRQKFRKILPEFFRSCVLKGCEHTTLAMRESNVLLLPHAGSIKEVNVIDLGLFDMYMHYMHARNPRCDKWDAIWRALHFATRV